MRPERANIGPGRAMRLAAMLTGFALAAPGASAAAPAVCTPPQPHAPMTVARLRSQGGDARPKVAALVNALFAHDDCLHAAAWRLRGAGDRVDAVARRIRAECQATLHAYHAQQLKLARTPADLAAFRRDDAGKDRSMAEGYVDDYRGCGR